MFVLPLLCITCNLILSCRASRDSSISQRGPRVHEKRLSQLKPKFNWDVSSWNLRNGKILYDIEKWFLYRFICLFVHEHFSKWSESSKRLIAFYLNYKGIYWCFVCLFFRFALVILMWKSLKESMTDWTSHELLFLLKIWPLYFLEDRF